MKNRRKPVGKLDPPTANMVTPNRSVSGTVQRAPELAPRSFGVLACPEIDLIGGPFERVLLAFLGNQDGLALMLNQEI